jgi:hypothetical protein
MKNILFITLFVLTCLKLHGQEPDSLGVDNMLSLNLSESSVLNGYFHARNITFNFENKKVAYYESGTGYISKTHFFNDMISRLQSGSNCPIQLIVLDENEKSLTSGYDAILVTWSKFQIYEKYRKSIIDQLRKNVTVPSIDKKNKKRDN